jgi:arylformamidase
MALYRNLATQAEIDAQYNASLRVPDPAAELRHYVDASARVRAALPAHLDVPYGPTRAETLDIFPAEAANAPVFIFMHGGYWRALSSKEFSFVAAGLRPLGITSVVVDYALCPKVTIDEIVRQVRAAAAWVVRNIANYGGDPTRVAIGGHSAGGHLTAMALATDWAGDYGIADDPFAAALAFSGLYDLAPLRYSYLQPMIQLDDGIIRRNSPILHARRCKTPLWITWGGDETDEFARQSTAFRDAWEAAGNSARLEPIAATHHFSVIHGLERADSSVCRWIAGRLTA